MDWYEKNILIKQLIYVLTKINLFILYTQIKIINSIYKKFKF